MKTLSLFVVSSLFLTTVLFQNTKAQSPLESGKKIPVYPGASLITGIEEDDSKECCNFTTSEGFDKVLAFYEKSLKLKPLDVNGLTTQLPFMKQQADMMLKQMPPSMKIRFFVLKEVEFQGQKGAELFEVYTSTKGVEFSIMESQLTTEDSHFSSDYAKAVSGVAPHPDPQLMAKALPVSGPTGYEKGDVETSGEGDNSAFVTVVFSKQLKKGTGGEDGTASLYSQVNITISEGTAEYLEGMIQPGSVNEKSVVIKGKYKGLQRLEDNGNGYREAGYVFVVNNKFLVELSATQVADMVLLNQVIDKMNLESLPK